MTFWYLATPYSKYPLGSAAAEKIACENAALLILAGIPVFSPIAHSHGIATHGVINPFDHEVWMALDRVFMKAARGLIVLKAEGWETSRGVNEEMKFFREANKPVWPMEPGHIPDSLMPPQTEGMG